MWFLFDVWLIILSTKPWITKSNKSHCPPIQSGFFLIRISEEFRLETSIVVIQKIKLSIQTGGLIIIIFLLLSKALFQTYWRTAIRCWGSFSLWSFLQKSVSNHYPQLFKFQNWWKLRTVSICLRERTNWKTKSLLAIPWNVLH